MTLNFLKSVFINELIKLEPKNLSFVSYGYKTPLQRYIFKKKEYYSIHCAIKPHEQSWDVSYVSIAIFILFECLTVN
jgi:hypothetical protein